MKLQPLPSTYVPTRDTLQRVATHVLARARDQAVGRFGMASSPGGLMTPMYGEDRTVVRISGAHLIVERGGSTEAIVPINGSSLSQLAKAAGADLSVEFEAGHDTPELGDIDAPIDVDPAATAALGDYYYVGWRAVDDAIAAAPSSANPSRPQLWPEHFDVGVDLGYGTGENDRCNYGVSPGDGFHQDPYLYVGPWSSDRPGDASYWNAPFGAILGYLDLLAADDPVEAGVAFFRRGYDMLAAG
jgi:hypothetical protein